MHQLSSTDEVPDLVSLDTSDEMPAFRGKQLLALLEQDRAILAEIMYACGDGRAYLIMSHGLADRNDADLVWVTAHTNAGSNHRLDDDPVVLSDVDYGSRTPV
jgi:hypothetical protein